MCRCSGCESLCEIPATTTSAQEMHEAVLPWVFSLIDPPVVQKPRMALTCDDCAKKIYGEKVYNEAIQIIRSKQPS